MLANLLAITSCFPVHACKRNIYIGDLGFKDENDGHILKEMCPDFYLPKGDTYIEVKGNWGSFTSNDRKRFIGAFH
jgi:hypothetical protein